MDKTWWMDKETFLRYQEISEKLQGLYSEHTKLIPELKDKPDDPRWKAVVEGNKRIAKLEAERKKILDNNPLHPKNIGKYLK